MFVIANPEVYKSPVFDIYIDFEENKIEDLSNQAQLALTKNAVSEIEKILIMKRTTVHHIVRKFVKDSFTVSQRKGRNRLPKLNNKQKEQICR